MGEALASTTEATEDAVEALSIIDPVKPPSTEESIMHLNMLPGDVLDRALQFVYNGSAQHALEMMPCFPNSVREVRSGRRRLKGLIAIVNLGSVCRRFHQLHSEGANRWVGCSRVLWCAQAFAMLRQVVERPLWLTAAETVRDEDFEWVATTAADHRLGSWYCGGHHRSRLGTIVTCDVGSLRERALQLVMEMEVDLKSGAVRGRAAAWSRNGAVHLSLVDAGARRLKVALREMLEMATHVIAPTMWIELQIILALWLTTYACLREQLLELHLEQSRGPQTSPLTDRLFRAIGEQWEHVHNGVCNGYYWRSMRPDTMQRPQDYARFVRIWRRAYQHVGDGHGGSKWGGYLLPSMAVIARTGNSVQYLLA
mmetsp:Transcript_59037/g.97626  ORF Transcript_59037/g.97626 Transcript_59037/m.97626 type:complete len:369 (+) Transcript_59037:62-1168(+)